MDQLQIMLITVTVQTGSTLISMETGLWLIVLKRLRKIKTYKKLNSFPPKPVTMPTIQSCCIDRELQNYQEAEIKLKSKYHLAPTYKWAQGDL